MEPSRATASRCQAEEGAAEADARAALADSQAARTSSTVALTFVKGRKGIADNRRCSVAAAASPCGADRHEEAQIRRLWGKFQAAWNSASLSS